MVIWPLVGHKMALPPTVQHNVLYVTLFSFPHYLIDRPSIPLCRWSRQAPPPLRPRSLSALSLHLGAVRTSLPITNGWLDRSNGSSQEITLVTSLHSLHDSTWPPNIRGNSYEPVY